MNKAKPLKFSFEVPKPGCELETTSKLKRVFTHILDGARKPIFKYIKKIKKTGRKKEKISAGRNMTRTQNRENKPKVSWVLLTDTKTAYRKSKRDVEENCYMLKSW